MSASSTRERAEEPTRHSKPSPDTAEDELKADGYPRRGASDQHLGRREVQRLEGVRNNATAGRQGKCKTLQCGSWGS